MTLLPSCFGLNAITTWNLTFLVFPVSLPPQTEPHQTVPDLQSHAGWAEGHLSQRSVSRGQLPHHQGWRCRVLETRFWRQVSPNSHFTYSSTAVHLDWRNTEYRSCQEWIYWKVAAIRDCKRNNTVFYAFICLNIDKITLTATNLNC